MDVLSTCPLRVAKVRWQLPNGAWMLTLVCKATFALRPIESPLAIDQDEPNAADRRWSDDPSASLASATDLAPFKPRADVLVLGHAHAPYGRPVTSLVARVVVGGLDKSIAIFGDRARTAAGEVTGPLPFVRVPLCWERSAGGPATRNPVGVRPDAAPDARGARPLPNLQPLGAPALLDALVEPTGVGPISPWWPSRVERLHRNAAGWSHAAWHERPLPGGLDFRYFNAAPPDQQLEDLRGDERIVLENLLADHPRLVTSLRRVAPRAVVERLHAAPQPVADLKCDTLCLDASRAIATLTWRARVRLASAEEAGVIRVGMEVLREDAAGAVTAFEPDTTMRLQLAMPRAALPFHAPPTVAPSAAQDEDPHDRTSMLVAGMIDAIRARSALPFKPAAPGEGAPRIMAAPAPPSRQASVEDPTLQVTLSRSAAAAVLPFVAVRDDDTTRAVALPEPADLAPTIDLAPTPSPNRAREQADPSPAREQAVPVQALPSLVTTPAESVPKPRIFAAEGSAERAMSPARADVVRRLASGASLAGLDLNGADLDGLDFTGCLLIGCSLRRARLTRSVFRKANLSSAMLEGADLTECDLRAAMLGGADLTEAIVTRARFDGATLEDATLAGAQGAGASFLEIKGKRASFAQGSWEQADFSGAEIEAGDFSETTLDGARFERASLARASLEKARGRAVAMAGARMSKMQASGARFEDCDLDGIAAQGSVWDGAELVKCGLARADLRGASLVGAICRGSSFGAADLRDARLGGADLTGARFAKANLDSARMGGAQGEGADFAAASMDGADLRKARLPGSSFEDASLRYARAGGSDLAGSRLLRADLRHASLRDAKLRGADLSCAQLADADLRGADLENANLFAVVRTRTRTAGRAKAAAVKG